MNIGFIGIGKIASAVIEGFCNQGKTGHRIFLSPRNENNSRLLAGKFDEVTRLNSNQEVVDRADLVVLALRPPHAPAALGELNFRSGQTILSLIPLLAEQEIRQMVGPAGPVTRAVPLPPVVNHQCPIPVYNPTPETLEVLDRIGQTFTVDTEAQLHPLWTLTCLITPYYDLLASMAGWCTEKGVDPELANSYTAHLFNALTHAAVLSDPVDFDALSHHAATPGGLNEQAGREILAKGSHKAFLEAAEKILGRFPEK